MTITKVLGHFYAMERVQNKEKVFRGQKALTTGVLGKGRTFCEAIDNCIKKKKVTLYIDTLVG